MTQFTDYAENKLTDYRRGQGIAALPASWWLALGSAADDDTFTELIGTDYARVEVVSSLANWAGTQGVGTVLASTGTSHATSNNGLVDFGIAGAGGWGDATHIGFFDDDTGGNCWVWLPLPGGASFIGSGDAVSFLAGSIAMTLGLTNGTFDYLANKLIDMLWRGQAYAWPGTTYLAYTVTMPSNSTPGTEPASPYARQPVLSTLTAWSSTQGNTAPSSGSSGRSANLGTVTWPAVAGDVDAVGLMLIDALTLGNPLHWCPVLDADGNATPVSLTVGGDAPRIDIGGFGITAN